MPTMEHRAYFVRRAVEVRELAAKAKDPDIRAILENMATSYDTLVSETDHIDVMKGQLDD
jgi:hypothetical protein